MALIAGLKARLLFYTYHCFLSVLGLVDVDAFLFVNGVVMGSSVPLGVPVSFSICDVVAPKYVPFFFLRLQVLFVTFVV